MSQFIMFNIPRRKIFSVLYTQVCSCNNSKINEKMPSDLINQTHNVSSKNVLESTNIDDMKWRTPWHQKEGQYYSTLRTFYSENNNIDVMKFLQTPFNLTPSAIKTWWARRQETKALIMQQYIPERNQTLGNELAAAHFIVYRGGSVKFFNQDCWIKADQYNKYTLPTKFLADFCLQAIDCSDMELYYEGLINMSDLKQVEWLSVNGCDTMDDWCMDRITNIFSRTLLYMDIRNCPNITCRGLGAIVKMQKLKILYVNNFQYSSEFELICLMLQQVLPNLDIRTE